MSAIRLSVGRNALDLPVSARLAQPDGLAVFPMFLPDPGSELQAQKSFFNRNGQKLVQGIDRMNACVLAFAHRTNDGRVANGYMTDSR